jgi:hypothetical protein
LIVPVLTFNLEQSFEDLIGRKFVNRELEGSSIVEARLVIRFRLDKTGTQLEIDPTRIGVNRPLEIARPRKMVFDKPFLIWLRETQATEPYFAAWIENTELMTPFAR